MQRGVRVGCRANASVFPSGESAGTLPVVSRVGLPPDTATDSTSSTQPCRLLKKIVWPSDETEISSPVTPLGTRVRTGAPVAELSRTSAPRVVTPAIAGGRAVVWLTGWASFVAVADAVVALACWAPGVPPPPQAATRVSAAGTA